MGKKTATVVEVWEDSGGGERVSVTKREAKRLHRHTNWAEFEENLDMIRSDLKSM